MFKDQTKKKQPKYAVTKKSLTSYAEMLKLYWPETKNILIWT